MFKQLHDSAIMPTRATKHSAGWDLHTPIGFKLKPGEQRLVFLGLAAEFPQDVAMDIRGRSGLAKRGLVVFQGLVDSDYFPNDLGVLLSNNSRNVLSFEIGDRIAQAVFYHLYRPDVRDGEHFAGERKSGFGSTGA